MRTGNRLLLIAAVVVTVLFLTAGSALSALRVNVMPSGVVSKINTWDSGPYTWPGNSLEMWGNVVYDGAAPLSYSWVFGDGGTAAGAVTNRDNIAVTHTYNSTGSYVATLTVTDGTETDSDTVFVDVLPQTLEVQTNLAIQKGLKYLYNLKRTQTLGSGFTAHYWPYNSFAGSALAVMAFENHGHLEQNDADMDIYAETVERGLNYLLYNMKSVAAANTPNTDSDINNNGKKIYCGSSNMYHVGITTMAIAATINPTEIVRDVAPAGIRGMTYRQLLEDMVDYIAYAQEHRSVYSGFGSWRYSPNYGSGDNSVAQWPALGLGEAERAPWNISAPNWVKTMLTRWINYSQCASNGGFGYTSPCSWNNVAKTGAGVVLMSYAGAGGNFANAINFMSTKWTSTQYDYGNIGDHYAMYAVKKGMEYANLSTVGGRDWQEEYNQWYVNNQTAVGNWPGSVRIEATNTGTSLGLLVMAPLEVCKPLADAGGDVEVSEGAALALDGSASTHTCSNSIVSYEWDFDYDGVNFDVDALGFNPVAPGYAITNGTDTQQYVVALRVTDDQVPAKVSLDTLVVTVSNGNLAPVADPGGPYLGAAGEDIPLDGSNSYDENSATGSNPIVNPATSSGFDEIVLYQWDTDGDGVFGAPTDLEGVNPLVNFGPAFLGTKTVQLKVTDSFGKSAVQSVNATTVAVSDLYPVGYELIGKVYNRRTRKWTISYKIYLLNDGDGEATNVSATLTAKNIPPGAIINDGTVSWNGAVEQDETQLSDDSFTYTYSREIDLTGMTWDIEFVDALGANHVIRNILQ